MANFGTQERRWQAGFRACSSTITDAGRLPSDDKGQRNGHLLALDNEQENLYPPLRRDAVASDFLSDRKVAWWNSSRSGDTIARSAPYS